MACPVVGDTYNFIEKIKDLKNVREPDLFERESYYESYVCYNKIYEPVSVNNVYINTVNNKKNEYQIYEDDNIICRDVNKSKYIDINESYIYKNKNGTICLTLDFENNDKEKDVCFLEIMNNEGDDKFYLYDEETNEPQEICYLVYIDDFNEKQRKIYDDIKNNSKELGIKDFVIAYGAGRNG